MNNDTSADGYLIGIWMKNAVTLLRLCVADKYTFLSTSFPFGMLFFSSMYVCMYALLAKILMCFMSDFFLFHGSYGDFSVAFPGKQFWR